LNLQRSWRRDGDCAPWGTPDVSGSGSDPARVSELAHGITRKLTKWSIPVKNQWGFIDQTGTFVIEPRFPHAGKMPPLPFSEGLACVWTDDGYGFIDRAGQAVLKPRFRAPASFDGGIAGSSKQGYIDRTGRFIWRPSN
jgi:hypothetical protein